MLLEALERVFPLFVNIDAPRRFNPRSRAQRCSFLHNNVTIITIGSSKINSLTPCYGCGATLYRNTQVLVSSASWRALECYPMRRLPVRSKTPMPSPDSMLHSTTYRPLRSLFIESSQLLNGLRSPDCFWSPGIIISLINY